MEVGLHTHQEKNPKYRIEHLRLKKNLSLVWWLSITSSFAALLIWLISLSQINIGDMSAFGLITVLPTTWFIASAFLIVGFSIALQIEPLPGWLLLSQVILLILILHGTPTFVESQPHFSTTWTHAGIIDFIVRNKKIDPNIDAYFNWPGFFSFGALISQLGGFSHPIAFISWLMAIFWNLLYLAPIFMILRWAARSEKLAWLGIWLFYLNNWVSQDYFAPQALGLFLYFCILAILLNWFSSASVKEITNFSRLERILFLPFFLRLFKGKISYSQPSNLTQRTALLTIILVFYLTMVASHQLTPVFTVAVVGSLVVLRQISVRFLPFIMIGILLVWYVFFASTFLEGHLGGMINDALGFFNSFTSKNVAGRIQGSFEHNVVIKVRMAASGLVWLTGIIGLIIRKQQGFNDLSLIVAALIPLAIMPFQSYGGEMILRGYLFALVPMVFFAAWLLCRYILVRQAWIAIISLSLLSLVLTVLFCLTRYGNEYMDYVTDEEVQGINYLYDHNEGNMLIISPSSNSIFRQRQYGKNIIYNDPDPLIQQINNLDIVNTVRLMQGNFTQAELDAKGLKDKPIFNKSYLIISRIQNAYLELFYNLSPSAISTYEAAIQASGEFELVFANRDVQIYKLREPIRGDNR